MRGIVPMCNSNRGVDMRQLRQLIVAAAVAALMGCATPQQVHPAVVEFRAYTETNLPRARAGDLRWSEYYWQASERLRQVPPHWERDVLARAYADMYEVARRYERGQISADDLRDAQRMTALRVDEQVAAARNAAAQQDAAARAANAQVSMQLLQMSRPRPGINCTTTSLGNALTTHCR